MEKIYSAGRSILDYQVHEIKESESLTSSYCCKLVDTCEQVKRYGVMAQGITAKSWITVNNEEYLFKADDFNYQSIGENFSTFFYKKFGMECPETSFAVGQTIQQNGLRQGSLSKSFMKKNTRFIPLDDFILTYCEDKDIVKPFNITSTKLAYEAVDYCTKTFYYVSLDPNFKSNLYKLAIIDYFACQVDRHANNIGIFLEPDDNGKLFARLAPIYDNGFCFAFRYSESDIKSLVNMMKEKNMTLEDVRMSNTNLKNILKINYRFVVGSLDSETKYICGAEDFGKNICKLVLKDKTLKEFYDKLMEINFENEIKEFEKIAEVKIPENYRFLMIKMFEERRDILSKTLFSVKNSMINEENEKKYPYYEKYRFAGLRLAEQEVVKNFNSKNNYNKITNLFELPYEYASVEYKNYYEYRDKWGDFLYNQRFEQEPPKLQDYGFDCEEPTIVVPQSEVNFDY